MNVLIQVYVTSQHPHAKIMQAVMNVSVWTDIKKKMRLVQVRDIIYFL